MKQLIVTAGFIRKDERVLIAQRRAADREGGKWEFPGGKVEFGEDPRQAMARELDEELGIKVTVGPILEVVSEVQGNLQLLLLYFECRIEAGEPHPVECQATRWCTVAEVDALVKPAADARFWSKFRHRLL